MKKREKIILIILIVFLIFVVIFLNINTTKVINPKDYGSNCELVSRCNDIVSIDCGSNVDGPFYYVNSSNGEILEYCGRYCMTDSEEHCQNCPPREWICKSSPYYKINNK